MAKKIKSHCTDGVFFDHTVINIVHNMNNNSNNVDDIIIEQLGFNIVDDTPECVHYIRHFDHRLNPYGVDHIVIIETRDSYAFIKSYCLIDNYGKRILTLTPMEQKTFTNKASEMLRYKRRGELNGRK